MGEGTSGGAGWYYLEYERRAVSASGVAGKLRGYIARRTRLPVLVAARSEAVATELRRQAVDAGHRLWAASIRSIRVSEQQNIAGKQTVWLDASRGRRPLSPRIDGSAYPSRRAACRSSGEAAFRSTGNTSRATGWPALRNGTQTNVVGLVRSFRSRDHVPSIHCHWRTKPDKIRTLSGKHGK